MPREIASPDPPTLVRSLVRLIRGHRYAHADERGLQDGVARVLEAAAIGFSREAALGDDGVIDFLIGDVGLEIKVGGSRAAVTRQMFRYAGSPQIASLVLVTTRARHTLPALLRGKPVHVCHLLAGAL